MSDANDTSQAYRLGVGIMLLNDQGKVFVGQRIDRYSDAWQMPQGGMHQGETPQESALRELQEEVGTNKVKIIAESQEWFYYDLPQELAYSIWDGKYRGQKQKWFVMQFQGNDTDINIHTQEPEFLAWKWVEPTLLPEIIVPFKKTLYNDVLACFRDHF